MELVSERVSRVKESRYLWVIGTVPVNHTTIRATTTASTTIRATLTTTTIRATATTTIRATTVYLLSHTLSKDLE
jgi:hypothetical protein